MVKSANVVLKCYLFKYTPVMLSIENFYYILYRHLLKPLDLQDAMFMKFGSVSLEHLKFGYYSGNQFTFHRPATTQNSCYYFDQEPMYINSIENLEIFSSMQYAQILANSEISFEKKQLCRHYNYQDWYYFFHGFAALDWYSDGQYFTHDIGWSKPYLSLNRLHTNDRSYRLNLVARLAAQDLLEQGHVSLHLGHHEYGSWQQEIASPETKLSVQARALIQQHINDSLIVDKNKTTGNISADFGHQEFELWKSGLWHIVAETVFYYEKLHLTEKIFKPIVAQRPFMLAAAPGNLAYLKSYGFETFDRWIDESYDTITDPDQRLQAIVDQTHRLCSMSRDDLQTMHQEMMPVLEHNFYHLYGDFKKRIVDELVDNFETAVRLWNNGRINSRQLPLQNVDLERVKKVLLG